MERNDPMTMPRLKDYRRNAAAIEDIKAELSGKYVRFEFCPVCGRMIEEG